MADRSHSEPVRVAGEQRLHPALRKMGRACIALAHWQREQQQNPVEPTTDEAALAPGIYEQPGTKTPAVPEQERRHD